MENKYYINEIFYSVQGEGTRAGMPCVFVRMQGCRLRCKWCDTPYALEFKEHNYELDESELIDKIKKYDCNFIEFTGGEPLEQENLYSLMSELCDEGYDVAVETSGYIMLDRLDKRVIKILDVKCPASGMHKKNKYENFNYIDQKDELKFVIANREDYDWAKEIVNQYELKNKTKNILFSPVFGKLPNIKIAEWILQDKLEVKMQLQMHKYIWHPNKRGV